MRRSLGPLVTAALVAAFAAGAAFAAPAAAAAAASIGAPSATAPAAVEAPSAAASAAVTPAAAPPAADAAAVTPHPPPLRGYPGAVPHVAPSPARGALTAKLLAPALAYEDAGFTERIGRLPTQTTYTRSGTRLLVTRAVYAPNGRLRLRVVVPLRPAGRQAWIAADAVQLVSIPWFVAVDRATRTARIFRSGVVVNRFEVVVGEPSTPTPAGLAALFEKVPAANPRIFTGPWSIHLTTFSRVLDRFGAGDGRIAIHGRGPASWSDPLGTAASHGCVRVDNYFARWIARHLPRGTPVRIT